MRQTACLVINPIIVDGYSSSLIARRGSGLRLNDGLFVKLTSGLELDDMSLLWPAVVQLLVFIYSSTQ